MYVDCIDLWISYSKYSVIRNTSVFIRFTLSLHKVYIRFTTGLHSGKEYNCTRDNVSNSLVYPTLPVL